MNNAVMVALALMSSSAIAQTDKTLDCTRQLRDDLISRCAEHFAEVAKEVKDRLECYKATLAPVGIGKDEFFYSEADRFRAKLKQDELIEACMLAKGWPKK